MSEPRDRQIVCNIEATIFDVAQLVSAKDGVSASTYVRNLIIKDLLARGMLSERVLAQVIMNQ